MTRTPNGTLDIDEHRLTLAFTYDAAAVAAIRSIPGVRWDSRTFRWNAPLSSLNEALAFAVDHHLIVSPDVISLTVFRPDQPPQIKMECGRYVIRIEHPMSKALPDARALPGAFWSPTWNGWIAAADTAPEVLEFARNHDADVHPSAVPSLQAAAPALARIEASRATDADLHIPGLGGDLMPFQRAGVDYVLSSGRRALIGDEPGLGKTVQALAALEASDSYPALVVCPSSLKLNWLREAQKWLPHRTSASVSGSQPYATGTDITIINYDVLKSWEPTLVGLRGLVVDESHLVKSPTAQRTLACIAVADRIPDEGTIVLLSGTPMLNRTTEMIAQLRILGRLPSFGGARRFRATFGNPQSAVMLNRRLRATVMVRRRKEDVLGDLPPKRWSTIAVEGDPKTMREYHAAERDLLAFLGQQARAAAVAAGADTEAATRAAWEAALRASAALALVRIGALKKIAARAKMAAARDWMTEFVDSGNKLVVFGWHRDIVGEVADTFADGCRIQGGMPNGERQAHVDRFQTDPHQKVIACSIAAAGVGLTLTAASDVLFLEQGWTPGAMDQAADRCHRIGQKDSVTAWNMLCAGTIDEDIAELIERKRRLVDAATDGTVTDEETSVATELLIRLTERSLAS